MLKLVLDCSNFDHGTMAGGKLLAAKVLKAMKLVVVAETQGAHCRNSLQYERQRLSPLNLRP